MTSRVAADANILYTQRNSSFEQLFKSFWNFYTKLYRSLKYRDIFKMCRQTIEKRKFSRIPTSVAQWAYSYYQHQTISTINHKTHEFVATSLCLFKSQKMFFRFASINLWSDEIGRQVIDNISPNQIVWFNETFWHTCNVKVEGLSEMCSYIRMYYYLWAACSLEIKGYSLEKYHQTKNNVGSTQINRHKSYSKMFHEGHSSFSPQEEHQATMEDMSTKFYRCVTYVARIWKISKLFKTVANMAVEIQNRKYLSSAYRYGDKWSVHLYERKDACRVSTWLWDSITTTA